MPEKKSKYKRRLAAITLLLLAPASGELLSSSAPPAEYFQLLNFLMLTTLYGCGALLIREMVRRWNKGWAAVFLLGMAYGIFEEGLVVRSFFDPNWGDLGILASYGRWAGVNWVWTVGLTLFHALVSIVFSIQVSELIHWEVRNEPWLSKRSLTICTVLFLSTLLLTPLFGMQASLAALAGSVVVIALLILLAYRSASTGAAPLVSGRSLHAYRYALGGILLFILIQWILPEVNAPPLVTLTLALLLANAFRRYYGRLDAFRDESSKIWLAAMGVLTPWLLLTLIAEFDQARPDDTRGMMWVGLGFLLLMLWLRRRIRKKLPAIIEPTEES